MVVSQPSIVIRIVAVPPGEAPYWVREKWLGLELPVARYPEARRFYGFGVLSQPRYWWAQWLAIWVGRAEITEGYAVEAAPAIDLLGRSNQEAAAWWREHAPNAIAPGRFFVFHTHACQVV
jgi:hypothetical protein